ncbi:MAG: cobalt ECF transporter T component CbiQ [Bacillota bacterium]
MITSVKTVGRSSIIHRWETRHKLLGFAALIFGFAFVRDLRLLPLILVASCLIYYLAALPFSYLFSRMRLPGFFLLVLAVILPFGSGETTITELGPLALKLEGSLNLLLIAVKFISILTLSVVLFASTPLTGLVGAMRSLGVPSLPAEMLLFTHRYIFQLADDLRRTRIAANLRGFKGKSLFSLKTLAYIVGTLLVRSHVQSERVFQAMTLRGYGRETVQIAMAAPGLSDRLALAGGLALAASLILAQAFLL